MALTRRLRNRGRSVTVTIPHDLVRMMEIRPGDEVEIEALGRDQLLLRHRPRSRAASAALPVEAVRRP